MTEWTIDTKARAETALLRGVFRLESPEAYDRAFAPIRAALEAAGTSGYTIDLAGVTLMNSSGIRALAELVIAARRGAQPLTFIAKASVPWQAKTMASLGPLHTQLTVSLA